MSLNVNELFQGAHDDGDLSAQSLAILNVPDVGNQIQNALGVSVDVVRKSEILLAGELVDDSGSIRFVAGNSDAVRTGHNGVLDALLGCKTKDSILIHCRYLNGSVLYPYVPLDQSIRMDQTNYNPAGGTPLYDQAVAFLGTVIAKQQEAALSGTNARSASLLITDGNDEHSLNNTEDDVRKLVTDLLRQEKHIIAGMGIYDGTTDFYRVFSGRSKREVEKARQDGSLDQLEPNGGMGIWPKWVLTPGNTPTEIRRAYNVFSQSAVRASQATGAAFSKVAGGGFTQP